MDAAADSLYQDGQDATEPRLMLAHIFARPGLTSILLLIVTAASVALTASRLEVTGDVARAIKGTSPAFASYTFLEETFGAPSQDEVLLVTAEDFGDPVAFTALEDLVLGLQFVEGVSACLLYTSPSPRDA